MTIEETIPEGIELRGNTLYTLPGVARVCTRCNHTECPCCNDWCDACLRDDPEPGDRVEGDMIYRTHEDGSVYYINKKCAEELSCAYETEIHPLMRALFDTHDRIFANVGGTFGVRDDRSVWMSGKTHAQVRDEELERSKTAIRIVNKATRDRAAQMKLFEKQFGEMNAFERNAYIAGMNHAMQLVVWRTEDAERQHKMTSTKIGREFIANLDADIDYMNTLRSK